MINPEKTTTGQEEEMIWTKTLKRNLTELLTEEEACKFLRISRVGILKRKRDRIDPIPCYKVGRRYLYEPGEVLRWAKRQAERVQKKFLKTY
jgi:hypothetical protein